MHIIISVAAMQVLQLLISHGLHEYDSPSRYVPGEHISGPQK
jgi:hypothetical protein